MDKNTPRLIQENLLPWYADNARDLPWRKTKDPYQIWVSEIMLQQTRVETVIPYFIRWMEIFPNIDCLAGADEDQVLSTWEGLGYYSRARNLHQAARILNDKFQSMLPKDPEFLQKLPGIGRYTAGAIASMAYGLNVPVLDGNVRRIFTRYFNIDTPLQTSETETLLWHRAQELLPKEKAGDYNQALMELGALICLPKNPICNKCPLSSGCLANNLNLQKDRPVRKKKSPLPHLQVTAAVIQEHNRVLLAKRPPDGLLGGMWEFPGGKQELNESLQETLIREIQEELNVDIQVGEVLGIFHHAYTHYKVTLHAFYCSLISQDIQLHFHTKCAWVPLESLPHYPMGKIDRLISQKL